METLWDTGGETIDEIERTMRQRHRARQAVRRAIKTGLLVPKPCVECGAEPAQAHHDDYEFPLLVVWLCGHHHAMEHSPQLNTEGWHLNKGGSKAARARAANQWPR